MNHNGALAWLSKDTKVISYKSHVSNCYCLSFWYSAEVIMVSTVKTKLANYDAVKNYVLLRAY